MREEMQLQVNLYTEREITKILKLMDMLVKAHKIKVEDDPELREMLRDLDHSYIEKKLTQQLTPKKENPLDLVTSIASMPVKELEKVVEGIEERRPFKGK
jgi:hypothetical protein